MSNVTTKRELAAMLAHARADAFRDARTLVVHLRSGGPTLAAAELHHREQAERDTASEVLIAPLAKARRIADKLGAGNVRAFRKAVG